MMIVVVDIAGGRYELKRAVDNETAAIRTTRTSLLREFFFVSGQLDLSKCESKVNQAFGIITRKF